MKYCFLSALHEIVERLKDVTYERIETWRKDTALSVRFDINENWIFKIVGHYIDGVAYMFKKMNPDGFDRYWKLYVAKLSYVF